MRRCGTWTAAGLTVGFFLAGVGAPALAQERLSEAENEQQYAACMVLVDQDPAGALESAVEWEKRNGGDAAEHCQALALIGLNRYEDAGVLLERIAQTLPNVKAPLASEVFGQAAYAWMLAGKPERALHDLNEGLKLAPDSAELLLDRAGVYGESGMFFEALDDLNAAVDLLPDRADIYVYRASTYIALNELDLAADNLDKALSLAPDFPEALLQRGRLFSLQGEADAARRDFMRILEIAPQSAAAEASQRQLEKLDIKAE
ncbi:MAG: tetratricopeptide repeat protein [Rhodospirillaceae bacterium]|nr:tetratricopeptide repeat protein [Rhodospirillaceae bacterium]